MSDGHQNKFKVGDRVTVTDGDGHYATFIGRTGPVGHVQAKTRSGLPLYTVRIDDDHPCELFWEDELVPAPEPGLSLSAGLRLGLVDALPPAAPLTEQEHYVTGGVEAIDFIEANGLGFCLGNAAKYIARAGKKGGPEDHVADLEKARNYITREINRLRGTPGWEAK